MFFEIKNRPLMQPIQGRKQRGRKGRGREQGRGRGGRGRGRAVEPLRLADFMEDFDRRNPAASAARGPRCRAPAQTRSDASERPASRASIFRAKDQARFTGP